MGIISVSIVSVLVLTCLATSASAATTISEEEKNCTPVNLMDPGESMHGLPIRNQGSLASCYAYSAAEMVDAWRNSHEDPDKHHATSAIAAVIQQQYEMEKKWNGKFDERFSPSEEQPLDRSWETLRLKDPAKSPAVKWRTGDSSTIGILGVIRQYGSCDEGAMMEKRPGETLREDKEFLSKLEGYWKDYQEFKEAIARAKQLDPIDYYRIVTHTRHDPVAKTCEMLQGTLPAELVPPKDVILFALEQDNPFRMAAELLKHLCPSSRVKTVVFPKPKMLPLRNIGYGGVRRLVSNPNAAGSAFVDSHLRQANSQPVEVGFCPIVYASPDYAADSSHAAGCPGSLHSALIIGQRYHNGKCQYLVRDHLGTSCSQFHWNEKSPSHKGQEKWDCTEGNAWIDRSAMLNNSLDLTTLGRAPGEND